MDASHDTAHQRAARDAISAFVHIDRLGAAAGGLFVGGAWVLMQRHLLLLPTGALLLLVIALTVAARELAAERIHRTLALAILANWLVAVAVTIAIPQLWPVMNITVLVPVVLATPHLDNRKLASLVAGAIVAAVSVTVIGLLADDGGALPDLEDEYELALVLGALIAHVVPSALIVWNNNRMQSDAMDRLTELNRDLEASTEALADSRQRVVQAADGERRRLERDLHDGAQQHLVALGVRLRLLEDRIGTEHELHGDVINLIDAADEAVEELRRLAHGIYPPLLESSGVAPALAAAARQSGLAIDVDLADIGRLEATTEQALFFTALEALTNVAKHAPGADVELRLATHAANAGSPHPGSPNPGSLNPDAASPNAASADSADPEPTNTVVLSVRDNGPGFMADGAFVTNGTNNMGDRLAVVGGTLLIESAPGAGTTVTAVAPHREAPAG